jgi:hypothetical protein
MSNNPDHIKDLISDPNNRRKHTPRNVGMIVDSLHKVGSGRSIVIDERNEILAGNATIEAAGEAGITKVKVVEADGDEIVAVKRTGLTDAQKRDLAIYDNRTGELADWNIDQLIDDANKGLDLGSFFSEDELDEMLGKHGKNKKDIPEYEFAEEIDFDSDYVVLKFNKDIDCLFMQEIFGLKAVKSSYGPMGKDGKPFKVGIGRVIDGMDGIEKIRLHFRNHDE